VIHDYLNGPGRVLSSEFAEIAVYNPLLSVRPVYKPFMSDLLSQSQLGQEHQSFEAFYVDWKFTLQFGTSIAWKVVGGSNFWPDQAQNYETKWSHESLEGTSAPMFEIKPLAIKTSESEFELSCLASEKQDQS